MKNTTRFMRDIVVKSRWTPIVLAGLAAGLICIKLYGIGIMNPINTSWLYANGDISQHQIGWDFFRNDSWRFPFGAIGNLAYPAGTSLVYMDSIPLAAITMKVFESFLPEHFQYFGIWGLSSFVLMGVFSALIVGRYTKNKFLVVVGALLITISPVFLMRTYAHTALASQWIILAGISIIVYRHKIKSNRLSMVMWAMLFALAVMVHPYFVPMSAILLVIYLILKPTSIFMIVSHFITTMTSFIVAFWLVGGFVTKDVGTATLGMFGADMNAIINPLNFSYFVKPFPTTQYAYEGLAYMGVGIYILLLVALWLALMRVSSINSLYLSVSGWAKYNKRSIFAIMVILASVFIAIGPVWYLNGGHVITFNIPDSLARIMSIFRSTGRFMWIASYAVAILAVVSVVKQASTRSKSRIGISIFLFLVLIVQFIDVTKSEGMKSKVSTIQQKVEYKNKFDTSEIRDLITEKEHVSYVENTLHANDFFELGVVVAQQGATINDGYISRKPLASVNEETARAHEALVSNRLNDKTVYITNKPDDILKVVKDPTVTIIQIDNTWIIARR